MNFELIDIILCRTKIFDQAGHKMDNEKSKKKDIETIEVEWVVYSQNDRVVRKYFQVLVIILKF